MRKLIARNVEGAGNAFLKEIIIDGDVQIRGESLVKILDVLNFTDEEHDEVLKQLDSARPRLFK